MQSYAVLRAKTHGLHEAPGQHPDTAVFSTEGWDNLQKNTEHVHPGQQHLVLRACLEPLITEDRGQRWQWEGSRGGCGRYGPHATPRETGPD